MKIKDFTFWLFYIVPLLILLGFILFKMGHLAIEIFDYVKNNPFILIVASIYIVVLGLIIYFLNSHPDFTATKIPYYGKFLKLLFLPTLIVLLFINVNVHVLYFILILNFALYGILANNYNVYPTINIIVSLLNLVALGLVIKEPSFGISWIISFIVLLIILSFISYSFKFDTFKLFELLFKRKLKLVNIISYLTNGWKSPLTKNDLELIKSNNIPKFLGSQKPKYDLITIDNLKFSVDQDRSIIIAYRKVSEYTNIVKYGVINKKGWWLYKPIYYISEKLENGGYYLYQQYSENRHTYFYIDRFGKRLNKIYFESATNFKNGLATVSIKKQYGLLNQNGVLVIQCKYNKIYFTNEYFITAYNGREDLYNYHGTLLGNSYESITIKEKSTIACFSRENAFFKENVSVAGYIDINGVELIKIVSCKIHSEENSDKSNIKYKVVKNNGLKTKCKYDSLEMVGNSNPDSSYFYGKIGNVLYYFDNNLKRTKIGKYSLLFIKGKYFVLNRKSEDNTEKISIFNKNNKKLIDTEYNRIERFDYYGKGEPIYKVYNDFKNTKDNCTGLITLKNKLILEAICDDIEFFEYNSDFVKIVKNDKYGLLNYEGEIIMPMKYDYWMRSFSNDIIAVFIGEKCGLFDPKSDNSPKLIYDDIKFYRGDYAVLKKNDKYCLLSPNAKKIYACLYDSINYIEEYNAWLLIKDNLAYINYNIEASLILDEISIEEAKTLLAENE